jgi:photosystem II stability/assembly factor-like uncharacterized protein
MNREATGSHPIRVIISIACLASITLTVRAEPIQAQAGSGPLPLCPERRYGRLFPSPNYANDGTIFWLTEWRYAGARHEVVLRSRDRGESWLQVFDYPYSVNSALFTAFDIAPEPESTGLVAYLGLIYSSWVNGQYYFYRTADGGDTWEPRTAPCNENLQCFDYTLRAADRRGVLFQPRFRTEYFPSLPAGVARSEDGGATWQQVWSETPAATVAVSPNYNQDETVFASLTAVSPSLNARLVISHDGGETWSGGGQGLCPHSDIEQLVASPSFARDHTVLASATWSDSSLFMSQDAGTTWQAIFPPGGPYCGNSDFGTIYPQFSPDFPEDPTIYAATTGGGLYASYDAGASWTLLAPNTSYNLAVRRAPETDTPAWRSSGQGYPDLPDDVHQVFLPLAAVQGSGPPYKPHTLFMEAHSVPNDVAFYRSDDGGRTWQCMNLPLVRPQVYLPLLRIRS